jgi:hypothetical protein
MRNASKQPLVFAGRSVTALLLSFALSASQRRVVPGHDQGEAACRPLSGVGAGAAGPAGRRRRPDVRQSRGCAAAGRGRQSQVAGGASSRRLPSLPEVPTIAETLPGFEAVAWYAIVAPPGTPKNITDKINADVSEALRQPELQDRLKKLSAETFGGSAEKSAQYMREEVERWGNVIKAADIKLQ